MSGSPVFAKTFDDVVALSDAARVPGSQLRVSARAFHALSHSILRGALLNDAGLMRDTDFMLARPAIHSLPEDAKSLLKQWMENPKQLALHECVILIDVIERAEFDNQDCADLLYSAFAHTLLSETMRVISRAHVLEDKLSTGYDWHFVAMRREPSSVLSFIPPWSVDTIQDMMTSAVKLFQIAQTYDILDYDVIIALHVAYVWASSIYSIPRDFANFYKDFIVYLRGRELPLIDLDDSSREAAVSVDCTDYFRRRDQMLGTHRIPHSKQALRDVLEDNEHKTLFVLTVLKWIEICPQALPSQARVIMIDLLSDRTLVSVSQRQKWDSFVKLPAVPEDRRAEDPSEPDQSLSAMAPIFDCDVSWCGELFPDRAMMPIRQDYNPFWSPGWDFRHETAWPQPMNDRDPISRTAIRELRNALKDSEQWPNYFKQYISVVTIPAITVLLVQRLWQHYLYTSKSIFHETAYQWLAIQCNEGDKFEHDLQYSLASDLLSFIRALPFLSRRHVKKLNDMPDLATTVHRMHGGKICLIALALPPIFPSAVIDHALQPFWLQRSAEAQLVYPLTRRFKFNQTNSVAISDFNADTARSMFIKGMKACNMM